LKYLTSTRVSILERVVKVFPVDVYTKHFIKIRKM
jgi:hypothetical protein